MLQTQTEILAPFEIWEVPLENGNTLKFHSPLVLQPSWMPDEQDEPDDSEYLELDVPELNISAFGRNRNELLSCIYSDIRMTWRLFVRRKDLELTQRQSQLRAKYLNLAEEVDNG